MRICWLTNLAGQLETVFASRVKAKFALPEHCPQRFLGKVIEFPFAHELLQRPAREAVRPAKENGGLAAHARYCWTFPWHLNLSTCNCNIIFPCGACKPWEEMFLPAVTADIAPKPGRSSLKGRRKFASGSPPPKS